MAMQASTARMRPEDAAVRAQALQLAARVLGQQQQQRQRRRRGADDRRVWGGAYRTVAETGSSAVAREAAARPRPGRATPNRGARSGGGQTARRGGPEREGVVLELEPHHWRVLQLLHPRLRKLCRESLCDQSGEQRVVDFLAQHELLGAPAVSGRSRPTADARRRAAKRLLAAPPRSPALLGAALLRALTDTAHCDATDSLQGGLEAAWPVAVLDIGAVMWRGLRDCRAALESDGRGPLLRVLKSNRAELARVYHDACGGDHDGRESGQRGATLTPGAVHRLMAACRVVGLLSAELVARALELVMIFWPDKLAETTADGVAAGLHSTSPVRLVEFERALLLCSCLVYGQALKAEPVKVSYRGRKSTTAAPGVQLVANEIGLCFYSLLHSMESSPLGERLQLHFSSPEQRQRRDTHAAVGADEWRSTGGGGLHMTTDVVVEVEWAAIHSTTAELSQKQDMLPESEPHRQPELPTELPMQPEPEPEPQSLVQALSKPETQAGAPRLELESEDEGSDAFASAEEHESEDEGKGASQQVDLAKVQRLSIALQEETVEREYQLSPEGRAQAAMDFEEEQESERLLYGRRRGEKQRRMNAMQAELRRTRRHDEIVLQCQIASVERRRRTAFGRWARWTAARRTAVQEQWWQSTEPRVRNAVLGTIPAERLRIVLVKLKLVGTNRAQRGGGTSPPKRRNGGSSKTSWSEGLQVACASVSRANPERGMNLKEFTLLLRKVARIVPSLATDEEIASIFKLAQDEQDKSHDKRNKRSGAGSEPSLRRAQTQRQRLLPRERQRRDDAAGFVSGLELAQLIQDLLGARDVLLQQASLVPVVKASHGEHQQMTQDHGQLMHKTKVTRTAQGVQLQHEPTLVQAISRLPARCLSASAPLHLNQSSLELMSPSSTGFVMGSGPYSPSLDVSFSHSLLTRRQENQQHETETVLDARAAATHVSPGSSLTAAREDLTLYLEEAARRLADGLLAEQAEKCVSGGSTLTSDRVMGKSSMDLPHDLTPPSSRTTSDVSPRPEPAAGELAQERLLLPHDISPPASPSPRDDAPGVSGAAMIEPTASAELDRVLAESASWLLQTEAAHPHLAH